MKKVITILFGLLALSNACYAEDYSSWHYNFSVELEASEYDRIGDSVELWTNFTEKLGKEGIQGSFDTNSIRLVRYNSTTSTFSEVPSHFRKTFNYNPLSNAAGKVIWVTNGTGDYRIFYDVLENGAKEMPEYRKPNNLVSLMWTYETHGETGSPVIADVDDDGKKEVIIDSSDGYVHVLDSNGNLKWSYMTAGGVRRYVNRGIRTALSVADLDNDGYKEVIYGSKEGKLYVLDGKDGTVLWKYVVLKATNRIADI
jgi:outer membrane protein assembly factor BamB